ncbi:hypothetical protein CCUN_1337 [Campylobacter cuniculorum DSM 23162 = LMG 24588]|uniref:Uncharacterized protein n=1 Tax=Campylobacter cuniculorum DSM 23162 = LMG 24588 TaxID=1121267 RepID=A0A1W6BXX0_9BACT|nr:hypothetical protein CCUN_1337 [Campylobacter cuniculorum DSM 23162 = LMG 24588]
MFVFYLKIIFAFSSYSLTAFLNDLIFYPLSLKSFKFLAKNLIKTQNQIKTFNLILKFFSISFSLI